MQCAEVYHPEAEAGVAGSGGDSETEADMEMGKLLRVDHHQRLPFTTPKNARVMKARDVDVGVEFPFAFFCRRGRDTKCDGC